MFEDKVKDVLEGLGTGKDAIPSPHHEAFEQAGLKLTHSDSGFKTEPRHHYEPTTEKHNDTLYRLNNHLTSQGYKYRKRSDGGYRGVQHIWSKGTDSVQANVARNRLTGVSHWVRK